MILKQDKVGGQMNYTVLVSERPSEKAGPASGAVALCNGAPCVLYDLGVLCRIQGMIAESGR